jgi:hypothetical protein
MSVAVDAAKTKWLILLLEKEHEGTMSDCEGRQPVADTKEKGGKGDSSQISLSTLQAAAAAPEVTGSDKNEVDSMVVVQVGVIKNSLRDRLDASPRPSMLDPDLSLMHVGGAKNSLMEMLDASPWRPSSAGHTTTDLYASGL